MPGTDPSPAVRPRDVRPREVRPLDVRGLAAIDLQGLESVASRLRRVDRKYLLTAREAQRLVGHLAHGTRVLEHVGLTSFRYASVYFDTARAGAGQSYRGAATGRRRRVKVRTRCYLDSRSAWLEVKSPTGRDESEKQRLPLDWSAVGPGLGGPGDPTSLPLDPAQRDELGLVLSGIGSRVLPEELHGVLRTSYTRTTLVLPREGSRLTVDTGLTCTDPLTSRETTTPMTVVETKSGQSPSSADRHLWRLGHRPVRISKFAVGLALLGLDEGAAADNRWHRTLRTLQDADAS